MNAIVTWIRKQYEQFQRDRALHQRIRRIEARRASEPVVIPPPFRVQARDRKIIQYEQHLALSWQDRWGIWEGDDGLWYGFVRHVSGWELVGGMADREMLASLTEHLDIVARNNSAEELHKLRNWKGYGL